jgi:transposase
MRPFAVEQTPSGYASLLARLRATGVAPARTLLVLEATSTYWVQLASTLHEAGYQVSVVNPKQAHDFAGALLQRAKTDPLDARMLAQLGAKLTPPRWAPPPTIYHELRQRLAQRDSLLVLRRQVLNQHHALLHERTVIQAVADRQQALVATIDEQIAALEEELAGVLAQHSAWAASIVRLQSIPGVGLVTAAWLVVTTLNFTACPSVEAATAYAGLAPQPWQSGSSVRGRAHIGHSGEGRLRTALYMATLSAARYNPQIKAHYERLRAAGKPEKVARCAAARKLLHLAWAIATKEQDFDPDHGKPTLVAPTS